MKAQVREVGLQGWSVVVGCARSGRGPERRECPGTAWIALVGDVGNYRVSAGGDRVPNCRVALGADEDHEDRAPSAGRHGICGELDSLAGERAGGVICEDCPPEVRYGRSRGGAQVPERVGCEPRTLLTLFEEVCNRPQRTCAQEAVQRLWHRRRFVGDPPDKKWDRIGTHLGNCCGGNPSLGTGPRRRVVDASPLVTSQPITHTLARVLWFSGRGCGQDQDGQRGQKQYA